MATPKFRITATERDDPDLRRLARALINLAIEQSADRTDIAAADDDAGHEHRDEQRRAA